MAKETSIVRTSFTSFEEAARTAFAEVPADGPEGSRAAEVARMWMSGGGFVGITQYHVELRVLAAPAAAAPTPADDQRSWSCADWAAVHDFMPGSPPELRVTAKCTADRTGFRFRLKRQAPQGFNPRDLLLRLVVDGGGDVGGTMLTEHEVRYCEMTSMRYDSVTILPSGPSIEVQVVS